MAAKEPTVELLVDRFLGRYGEPSRGWERKDLEAFAHALAERAWDECAAYAPARERPENPYRIPKGPTK